MIDPRHYGIVEMAFTGLVVLGLAFWQLWSLAREQKRDRAARDRAAIERERGD